jgi:hypothetical protein
MSKIRKFTAPVEAGSGGGAFVTVPFDVEAAYGKKRVPILAHIDGEPYRGTLVRMGTERHLLLIRKEIRERIGKTVGDLVAVTLEEDTSPRVVEVPADLAGALADEPAAEAFFRGLAFTHQREYVQWLTEAKRAATRRARLDKIVALLKAERRER